MKSERQENILEILKGKRFATVEFLAKTLYSSAPTIRRDLNEMEEKGFVKRSSFSFFFKNCIISSKSLIYVEIIKH